MGNSDTISFIGQEMLCDSPDDDRVAFVTNAVRLAEEDSQMLKLMLLWMTVAYDDTEGKKEIEYSMKDYLRRKALWQK